MTFFQRLSGFVFTIDAFFKIFLLISVLTIPIVLVSGGTLVAHSNFTQLRWQVRLAFAVLILSRVNEYITYIPSGYRLSQRDTGAQLWMAPYHALTIIKCFIFRHPMAFSSSGSLKDALNERDAHTRAPLWRRLKVILWDCKVWMHLSYVAFTVAAVALSCVRAFTSHLSMHKILIYLLTHALAVMSDSFLRPIALCSFPSNYAK